MGNNILSQLFLENCVQAMTGVQSMAYLGGVGPRSPHFMAREKRGSFMESLIRHCVQWMTCYMNEWGAMNDVHDLFRNRKTTRRGLELRRNMAMRRNWRSWKTKKYSGTRFNHSSPRVSDSVGVALPLYWICKWGATSIVDISKVKVKTGYLYSGTVSLTATGGCRLFCSALPVRSA